ncbi:MAG TPA: cupin domain-containing protein, partial [Solirubrobacteraceae bacterium]|nr:cupin domain-containing protein [Solirubrobacteraceae bacterium]
LEGGVRLTLDGSEHSLRQGDYASIPPGTTHGWQGEAFFTKVISMSTPGGLEAALDRIGEATELHMFAEGAALSADALGAGAQGVDVQVA